MGSSTLCSWNQMKDDDAPRMASPAVHMCPYVELSWTEWYQGRIIHCQHLEHWNIIISYRHLILATFMSAHTFIWTRSWSQLYIHFWCLFLKVENGSDTRGIVLQNSISDVFEFTFVGCCQWYSTWDVTHSRTCGILKRALIRRDYKIVRYLEYVEQQGHTN